MTATELPHLPVATEKERILAALSKHQVIVVAGETGTGKSTLLPLICAKGGYTGNGAIAITQPRRIAATSLARYCASLAATSLGNSVGYIIRYEKKVSENTRIMYMTDGILLSYLHSDPLLRNYSVLIIDEAHERSVTIDFLLGYIRSILPQRPDLRVIISSATIDTILFSRAFNHAPIITVSGKSYDISVEYRPVIELWKGQSIDSYIEGAIVAVQDICSNSMSGDILLFFPTIDDVMESVARLRYRCSANNLTVLPLHGRLSSRQQQDVFNKSDNRKVIVATNIAETSLTVPGIRFVVDTGLVRMVRFDQRTSISRMPVEKISRASAEQRSGRCGRLEDGCCIRLYSEEDFLARKQFTDPEIKRSNLSGVLLRMYGLELGDPYRFPFLQRPSTESIVRGFNALQELGALDERKHLTEMGRKMSRLPLDPPVACMLLHAEKMNVLNEITVIAAALSVDDPLLSADGFGKNSGGFTHPDSDFMVYVNVWNALQKQLAPAKGVPRRQIHSFCRNYNFQPLRIREWLSVHTQLMRIIGRSKYRKRKTDEKEIYARIHRTLLSGLVHGVARYSKENSYVSATGEEVRIASVSMIARKRKKWVLFNELLQTSNTYGIIAAEIRPVWIEQCFKRYCRYHYENPWYDEVSETVKIHQRVTYHSLTLLSNRIVDCHKVDRRRAVELFISDALVKGGIGDRYQCIRHNIDLKENLENAGKKLRTASFYDPMLLAAFYAERIDCATGKELRGFLKKSGSERLLSARVEDISVAALPQEISLYHDEIEIASYKLPVQWEFLPDEQNDGATLTVPGVLAEHIPCFYWEWQLPVLCRKRAVRLVSWFSSEIVRKGIDPVEIEEAINALNEIPDRPWIESVAELLSTRLQIRVDLHSRISELFPHHLWLRVNVVDEKSIIVDSFRSPFTGRKKRTPSTGTIPLRLQELYATWEKDIGEGWADVPLLQPRAVKSPGQEVPILLYPALHRNKGVLKVRAFMTEYEAISSQAVTLSEQITRAITEPMAWEIERMTIPNEIKTTLHSAGLPCDPQELTISLAEKWVCRLPEKLPVEKDEWNAAIDAARERVNDSYSNVLSLLKESADGIIRIRRLLDKKKHQLKGMYYRELHEKLMDELDGYISLFHDDAPVTLLFNLPTFFDAFGKRAADAFVDPGKYRRRSFMVKRYIDCCGTSENDEPYLIVKERGALREMVAWYLEGPYIARRHTEVDEQMLEKQLKLLHRQLTAVYR